MYNSICVGWLAHVIPGHYVHAEPRSAFLGVHVHANHVLTILHGQMILRTTASWLNSAGTLTGRTPPPASPPESRSSAPGMTLAWPEIAHQRRHACCYRVETDAAWPGRESPPPPCWLVVDTMPELAA